MSGFVRGGSVCALCKRPGCIPTFHSFAEQERHDAAGRCQFLDCERLGAQWEVDPDRPAFSYKACAKHAREAIVEGVRVDGPELDDE